MAADGNKGKQILLVVLGVIALGLVYRNIIHPALRHTSKPAVPATVGRQGQFASRAQIPAKARHTDKTMMTQQELAALDPTLRLDLLRKVAGVDYKGGSRNIFQFYTPPPKPVAPAIVPTTHRPSAAATALSHSISLKFYGMSTHPGSPVKRAFLTDGDKIFIGQEGDIVDKHYKIVQIGVNSLEWEDTRSHQRGQLPLMMD